MAKVEVTLEIDVDLLERARAAKIDISAVLEQTLNVLLGPAAAAARGEHWTDEDIRTARAYRQELGRHGLSRAHMELW